MPIAPNGDPYPNAKALWTMYVDIVTERAKEGEYCRRNLDQVALERAVSNVLNRYKEEEARQQKSNKGDSARTCAEIKATRCAACGKCPNCGQEIEVA